MAPAPSESASSTVIRRLPGSWYDTTDRAAIRDAYNNVWAPSDNIAMGWTGSVSGCNAGDTSAAWKAAVLQRINYVRGMAGVPMGVGLSSTFSGKNQKAALMMSANQQLSHFPPANWTCYTAEGAEAAGKSNICALWGYGNADPGCVLGYMDDSDASNTVVGHRRWLIYPQSTTMGTGDVAQSGSNPRANALWVIDSATFGTTRPATRDGFVAWPPKGYVPYPIVSQRWSFSNPSTDFSNATITVTKGGVNQTVNKLPVATGYGENTVVWDFSQTFGNPGADATYTVTISNVSGGPFTYNVIVFDPATAGTPTAQTTINTNPQGLQVMIDSTQYTAPASFNWTSGSQHTINVVTPQVSSGTRSTFTSWNHGGAQSQSITAGSSDTAYTANFSTQYLLTATASPGVGGSIGASPSSGDGYYSSGQSVQLTATPNSGYQFSNWTGSVSGTSNPLSVTMNGPRSQTANFTATVCNYSLSSGSASFGSGGGSSGFNVTTTAGCSWSVTNVPAWVTINSGASGTGSGTVNYTVASNSSTARNASLAAGGQSYNISQSGAQVSLTFQTSPSGLSIQVAGVTYTSPQTIALSIGDQVSLNAVTPQTIGGNTRYNFTGWSNGPVTTGQTITVPSSAASYTASYSTQYLLSIAVAPAGSGSVAASPFSADGYYASGQAVQLTATANSGYQFSSWTGAVPGSTSPTSVTMSGPRSQTANFTAAACSYSLSSASASFGSSGGTGSFNVTTTAGCNWSVTNVPAWVSVTSGANGTGSGTVNYTVTANGGAARNVSLAAGGQSHTISQSGAQVNLTFQTSPAGLSIQVAGVTYTSPRTVSVNVGDQLSFSAITPQLNAGATRYNFTGWSNGGALSQTITVPASPATYTASYSTQFLLAVSANPAGGGTVSISPPSADGFYNSGSSVQLTASANAGYLFSSYSGDLNGGTATQSLVMTAPRSVTATFTLPSCNYSFATNLLSLNASGGTGSVQITAGNGCAWTVSGLPSWVIVTSAASGSGNGVVNFQVPANPTAASRNATLSLGGQTFSIQQAAATTPGSSTAGLRFVKMDPCRVMETRAEYNFQGRTGAFGPPFVAGGEIRTMNFPQSNVCSIPASAKAFVLNVTLVPHGAVDYVTVWPGGEVRPDFRTISAPDGKTVANSAIVKAGVGGAVSVYSTGSSEVLLDVSGYFTDDPQASNLAYYPLTPCRVLDTRSAYRSPNGPFGPPTLNAGETRSFRFPTTPYCTVPSGAAAYSVTITAVPPAALQYLTAWPAGASQPNVSSINSPEGRVLANSVILPASADGSINSFVFDRSDVLIDITGYFAPDDGRGLLYFAVPQCRVADASAYGDEAQRTLAIASSGRCTGIPPTAAAYSLHVTAFPGGSAMPFLTAWPTGQPRPNASLLNAFQGQTVTNSGIVPAGTNGSVDIYTFRRTDVLVEVSGYFGR